MSATTKIEWCDSTFNPWIGCTRVSPACDDCYAARSSPARALGVQWGAGQPRRRTTDTAWRKPLQWNRESVYECDRCSWRGRASEIPCATCPRCEGRVTPARRRVFCASLADVFDNEVPAEWRADLFDLIDDTPNLDWLLLTKRIGNVPRMMNEILRPLPTALPRNVWLGATVVNQEEADRDTPKLLALPARVRFLSIEPMLGPIELRDPLNDIGEPRYSYLESVDGAEDRRIHWVIVGGESGPRARPMHPDWARSLRDQCQAANASFLFKQWGEWLPGENHNLATHAQWQDGCTGQHPSCSPPRRGGEWRHFTKPGEPGAFCLRVGKKAAGRTLDGRTWNEFPRVA